MADWCLFWMEMRVVYVVVLNVSAKEPAEAVTVRELRE